MGMINGHSLRGFMPKFLVLMVYPEISPIWVLVPQLEPIPTQKSPSYHALPDGRLLAGHAAADGGGMTITYFVDAEMLSLDGNKQGDFHLETTSQVEAESAFLHCWFEGRFWDVRIRKEWRKDEGD